MPDETIGGEGTTNWATWRGEKTDKVNPRDINYLLTQLNLPTGLTLESRAPLVLDGRMSYAIVATVSNEEVVTFDLSIFFYASQIQLLKDAVDKALAAAKSTGVKQVASFRDPNAE